jgi:hypothetical protein
MHKKVAPNLFCFDLKVSIYYTIWMFWIHPYLRMGFHGNLYLWIHHGERGVVLEDGQEDDYDDNLLTMNFRQPSNEFIFNVGIDLLF